jgi:NDP-sugar pyrophosphorylase family protein
MQAVILAAGLGKRLRPLTLTTPKPLLKVAGRPILEHTLRALPRQITEVVIVVNYLAEKIKEYFGTSFAGKTIQYAFQKDLKGSGAALTAARDLVTSEKYLVLMGDDLYHADDLAEMAGHDLAILAREVSDPARFGTLTLKEDGTLDTIKEAGDGSKKPPYLVNCAVYTLDQRYFSLQPRLTPSGEIGLPQTMAQLTSESPITVVRAREWHSVGTPEELEKVNAIFSKL